MKTFTAYEIAPCVDAGATIAYSTEAEQLDEYASHVNDWREGYPEVSKFWTLYGFADDCLSVAIADRGTFEDCAELYARLTGLPAPVKTGERMVGLPALNLQSLLETAAYLGQGFENAKAMHNFTVSQALDIGDVSAVAELVQYALPLSTTGDALSEAGTLSGCYDYDVTEPFARWFGKFIRDNRRMPSREEAQAVIARFVAGATD